MDPARDDRGEGRRRLRAAWFTYVRAPLEEFRWIIIAFLALITVALGYWGFQRYQFASSQNFLDRLYLTLRLFRSGVTVDPPLPIQLEIARWLAWVVLIATTVGALLSVLRDRFDLVRVRFARNHVLICGLGRCGRRLAVGFRRRGYPVVVIESDPSSPGVEAARREGIIVIAGDATEPSMLLRAGLGRARRLIATCGDDGRNVAVITTAHEQIEPARSSPLDCSVQVVDPDVRRFLTELAIRTPKASTFRLNPFAVSELGVPGLLVRHPPFDDSGRAGDGDPRLVVAGLGQTGGRLVLGAAHLWATTPAHDDSRLHVTIIDKDAEALVGEMTRRFPALFGLLELVPRTLDVDSPLFPDEALIDGPDGVGKATTIYVCLDEELRGLKTALILRRALGGPGCPIVIRTTDRSTLTTFPAGLDTSSVNVWTFNMLDRGCTPDVILRGANEVLAQAIHAEYVRIETERGGNPETNPSMVDWRSLPEDLKDSNRDQAAHVGTKLREIGCDITSVEDLDPVPPVEFSHAEVERLAELEHQRWLRERSSAGWRWAPEKNISKKLDPDLAAWPELAEPTKDQDRNTVRALPAFLAKAGFAIVRS